MQVRPVATARKFRSFSLFLLRAYTHWDQAEAQALRARGQIFSFHPKRFRIYLLILLLIYLIRTFWNPVGLPSGLPIST